MIKGSWVRTSVFSEMRVGDGNRSGRGHLVSLGLGSKHLPSTVLGVPYLSHGDLFNVLDREVNQTGK